MRVPVIAGNWKMNTTLSEAEDLVNELGPGLDEIEDIKKIICPPYISLSAVRDLIEGSSIKLGAQNLYFETKGAYTGEVSPTMLAELCEYVIIGHSERRQFFGETGDLINKKVMAALRAGLNPILCVGESLEEREAGRTEEIVSTQLKEALAGVGYDRGLVIAYEPVWAIGTGKAATGRQANGTIGLIRGGVSGLYGEKAAQGVPMLYGGSVTADNIVEFIKQPEIDGALVGGASLKVNEFVSIVRQTSEIKGRQSG